MAEKILYFGGQRIVRKPEINGEGFICTEDATRAKENAVAFERGGILNLYGLDMDALSQEDFMVKGRDVVLKTENAVSKLRFLGFGPVDVPEKRKKSQVHKEEKPPVLGQMLLYVKHVKNEDPVNFFRLFRISGLAEDWESNGDSALKDLKPDELYSKMIEALGGSTQEENDVAELPDDPKIVWIGDILEFLQKETGKSFTCILEDISIHELEVLYEPLKVLPGSQSFLVIREKIRQKEKKTWLQRIRRRSGLSQKELSEKSGVNLRTLQQYEIRDKDIDKAAAGRVLAMARVLSCKPEDLMEW